MYAHRIPFILGGLLLAGVTAAHGDVLIVQPSIQDAYVDEDLPRRINGASPTNTRFRVRSHDSKPKRQRGLLQFDVAGIPPAAVVNSATVQIYEGNNPSSPVTHGLHRLDADWLQSATKWTNQPTHQAAASATAAVGTSTGFKTFSVTADVAAFVNLCSTNHGWMVKDQAETATTTQINYVSREATSIGEAANRPKLTVDFTPPPCLIDADCADTNSCTTAERCVSGVCVVTPVSCDDGNPCTDDLCDCDVGCINAPICNDGFSCTTDTCDPNTLACTFTPSNAGCLEEGCATGTCIADPDRDDLDDTSGCLVTSTQPDGTQCTADALPCTNDVCQGGKCTHPQAGSGASCSDGDLCTDGDVCDAGGTCAGAPVVCTPLSQCHDAGTCTPGTGVCTNPPKPGATPCSDGDLCTQTDACDGAGTCVGANPVVCTPLDQCHDTGVCDSQSGVCSNPVKPNGTTCDDANVCTLDDECQAGECGGVPSSCGDGVVQPACSEECEPTVLPGGDDCTPTCQYICGPAPAAGCKTPIASGRAFLKLQDKSPDKRDQALWRWIKGQATTVGDFGDPLTTTEYTMCLWDESVSAQPIMRAIVPAGGTCAGKPCWKAIKGGAKYKDKDRTPDGILQLQLKSGTDGRAKIILKGKGEDLPIPTLPLTPKVTIQIKSDLGVCWEAEFSQPKKNEASQFKAKAD